MTTEGYAKSIKKYWYDINRSEGSKSGSFNMNRKAYYRLLDRKPGHQIHAVISILKPKQKGVANETPH